jgi:hypothetical protein
MDYEDFDPTNVGPTGDPIIDRGDVLIRLAFAAEQVKRKEHKALIQAYMVKVFESIRLSKPKAELRSIDGGKFQ